MRLLFRRSPKDKADQTSDPKNGKDGLKAYMIKMPRKPSSDKRVSLLILSLSDRDSLTEQKPAANAGNFFMHLVATVAHEELVELRKLLPER